MSRACFVFVALLAGCLLAQAEAVSRIRQSEIKEGKTFILKGNVHPLIASGVDEGPVDSGLALNRISVHIQLSAAQQADLAQLLKDLQDRTSPQFHKFLTPAQFGDRFGLSTSDMNKLVAWLASKGFTGIQPSTSRTFVRMSAPATLVENAFQLSLHRFHIRGEEHFANVNAPVLPKDLDGLVSGIRGLNDLHPRPRNVHPHFTSSISGDHFIAPSDFATIYDLQSLYSSGIDGSGISIAIAGQTDIQLSDIEAFRTASGLQQNDPTVVLAGDDPGTSSGDLGEADLDLEQAGSVAPNASIIYVNSTDVFDSLIYAIDNNLAPIVSVSYGNCEPQTDASTFSTLEPTFQEANALGITVLAAAGDVGAADCDTGTGNNLPTSARQGLAVDYPGSSPEVTSVGGSAFTDGNTTGATQYWSGTNNGSNGSALSYIPETVWNDTTADGSLAAGGGGVSIQFKTKPSWQTGPGVPNDGARDVPDIALTASPNADGVLICSGGWCTNGFRDGNQDLDVTGGTSVGAPSFAGIVALINQKTGSRQGNVNPTLYQLAAAGTAGAFHDITTGNNIVPCVKGTANCTSGSFGYSAGAGYDLASGLGSVDGANLVNAWPADRTAVISSVSPQSVSTGSSSFTITVNGTDFTQNDLIYWNKTPLTTTYVNATTLTATVPASLLTSASMVNVSVQQPAQIQFYANGTWGPSVSTTAFTAPNGYWSFQFVVPAAPAVTQVTAGQSFTVTNLTSFEYQLNNITVSVNPTLLQFNNAGFNNGGMLLTLSSGGETATFDTYGTEFYTGSESTPTLITGINTANVNFYIGSTTGTPIDDVTPTVWTNQLKKATSSSNLLPLAVTTSNGTTSSALQFVPVTPCRVVDTRTAPGALGGPSIFGGSSRNFAIPQGACNIPATAQAYSLNVTAVPQGELAYLTIWPAGQTQPVVSTLNSLDGRVKANAAIVPAGTGGAVSVYVTNTSDVVLDINGYFIPSSSATGELAFYPVTPCRVADTRNPDGSQGGPALDGVSSRTIPVAGVCNIPSTAQAYSLNFTAVPKTSLGYLTTWPTGDTQPVVSTLNATTGTVTANAAIVPAGTSGAINVFASNPADVVVDVNGYFAPAATGGLSFYTLTPCRIGDTRNASGTFGGPSLSTGQTRNWPITQSVCGVPSTAQAFAINTTVVPSGDLAYLTVWPTGVAQPVVSTLNSLDGSVVSNAAIVPGSGGSISSYVTNPTGFVLDINGYFAP